MSLGRRTLRPASLVGAVVLAAALAACDDGSPFDRPFTGLGPADPGTVAHVVSASRDGLRSADFELASGVTSLTVRSGDIGGSLYRIATPPGGGLAPAAVVSGDHVVAQLVSIGTNGPSTVDVTLSSAVAWTIHLDGGATAATVDMRDGGLAGLDFGADRRCPAAYPAGGGLARLFERPDRSAGGDDELGPERRRHRGNRGRQHFLSDHGWI